ncbi:FKBP12-associated protein [Coccidioides immitis]|nr:FKBP12-associated protein [Coccidioides immitis]
MSTHISQIAESQDGNELRHNDSSRGGRGTRNRRNRNRDGHGGRGRSGVAHHTSGGDRGSRPSGRSRGRGGRRGDGEARRAQHISAARVDPGSGRIFAGRLTRPDELENANDRTPQGTNDSVENGPASLRADAPEFVPGAPSKASPSTALDSYLPTQRKPKQPRNPKTKSTADDIATRTHEDIQNGFYECPICTSELGRRSKDQQWNAHEATMRRTQKHCGLDYGGVPVAICHKMLCRRFIAVGVKRRSTLDHYPACLHILVVKAARSLETVVHIHAI